MTNSVSAVRDEPKGSVDPARVLEKAYTNTKAKGSSTACIIALTNQVTILLLFSFQFLWVLLHYSTLRYFCLPTFEQFISFLQGLNAINLGDSGFMVVRDGCTVFRSPAQQHDFNFTYQLENGSNSDLPSSGQVRLNNSYYYKLRNGFI